MALAAALEDHAHPEALYVVYMKLAEIHGNHMPDAELCQVYRDRAQSLKRVLAGEEGAAVGEEDAPEPGQKTGRDSDADVERIESLVKRNGVVADAPENEKCEDSSFPRTCIIHIDTEDRSTDANNGDTNGKEDHDVDLPDTDGPFVDASETETTASQSCSDSILTESFDTAKEQISGSSSSTDTLQIYHSQADGKDSHFAHSTPGQTQCNHTSDVTRHTDAQNRDSDIQDEQNTATKEADARADPVQKDVSLEDSPSDTDQTETNTEKAVSDTEKDTSGDTRSGHVDLDDVYT